MESKKYYWTTKSGAKIDVDEMTLEHLRNVLKMILRQRGEAKDEPEDLIGEYDYYWKDW